MSKEVDSLNLKKAKSLNEKGQLFASKGLRKQALLFYRGI